MTARRLSRMKRARVRRRTNSSSIGRPTRPCLRTGRRRDRVALRSHARGGAVHHVPRLRGAALGGRCRTLPPTRPVGASPRAARPARTSRRPTHRHAAMSRRLRHVRAQARIATAGRKFNPLVSSEIQNAGDTWNLLHCTHSGDAKGGGFKRSDDNPLDCELLVCDFGDPL
jgi:hypothetical protein